MADNSPVNGNVLDASQYIYKSQRNATRALDWGRIPKLEDDGFLHGEFVKDVITLKAIANIDGTSTPKAVFRTPDNQILPANIAVLGKVGFFGFTKKNIVANRAKFLNGQQYTTASSQSHTVNAGTDRLVVVQINNALVGTTVVPSAVSWNGLALTMLLNDQGNRAGISVWYRAVGTNAGSDTGNIVITGGTGQASVFATNWEYVDQSSPFQASQIVNAVAGLSITKTLTLTESHSQILEMHCDRNGNNVTMDSKLATRYTEGTSRENADGTYIPIATITLTSSTTTTAYTATDRGVACALALRSSTSGEADIEVIKSGFVTGFSGLTKGLPVYVNNTDGSVTQTAPAVAILAGIATSTTEILIKTQPQKNSGVISIAGAGNQVVMCGFIPSRVRVTAILDGGSVTNHSFGSWTALGGNSHVVSGDDNGSGEQVTSSTSLLWRTSRLTGAETGSSGTLSAVSASGFTLNVSYTSGTTLLYWEAEE